MKQQNQEVKNFEKYRKKTRKDTFLEQMREILPWTKLCKAVELSYPKPLHLWSAIHRHRSDVKYSLLQH